MTVELEVTIGICACFHSIGIIFGPDEFFYGVIEVEFDFGRSSFITGELELFNEVLMGDLGKSTSFISIEVDVIDVEFSRINFNCCLCTVTTNNISGGTEFNVDFDFVVLESNEGKSKTRVSAEPELKGNVKSSFRFIISFGEAGIPVTVTFNHGSVTIPVTSSLGEFVPDVEPVTVVFVNSLTTNLDLDGFDEFVSSPVFVTRYITCGCNLTKFNLEVYSVDKITVSRYSTGYFTIEIWGTVESLSDRLHREVGVSTVDNLEESNLGITGKVNILSPISDELHKSSTHF